MIRIEHVSATYPYLQGKVLEDVSCTFSEGKLTVLMGQNGCGKSTLLRTILGLHPILQGEILYENTSLLTLKSKERAKKLAFLPQSRNIPSITAERLVMHGRFPYLGFPREYSDEDKRITREALLAVDAEDLSKRLLTELSGGQRQKIYIAMALAQGTETILLDEPTTYLDIHNQKEVMEILKGLTQGDEPKTVIAVLHDLPLAMTYADRIVLMEHGRIRDEGTPEELYERGTLEEVLHIKIGRVQEEHQNFYYVK